MFAPAERSSCTTSACPSLAAHMSGVLSYCKIEKDSDHYSDRRTTIANGFTTRINQIRMKWIFVLVIQHVSAWPIRGLILVNTDKTNWDRRSKQAQAWNSSSPALNNFVCPSSLTEHNRWELFNSKEFRLPAMITISTGEYCYSDHKTDSTSMQ